MEYIQYGASQSNKLVDQMQKTTSSVDTQLLSTATN